MANIKRVQRCHLCGAVLQSKSKKEKGFITGNILNNESYKESILYCDSCLQKMKSINRSMLAQDADDDVLTILKDANATDGVILYVVDAFLFTGSLNPDVMKRISNLKVSVLATHCDLFGKKDKEKICEFIAKCFADAGVSIKEVIPISKYEDVDTELLYKKLNEFRKGHDVYMIGALNSGKTSIINKMLKTYKNNSKRVIRTIDYEGTNAKVLEIPFNNSSFFYELPSFSPINCIENKVEKEIAKQLRVERNIKICRTHLFKGDSTFVGNLCALTLVKGKDTPVSLFCSNAVSLVKRRETDYGDALARMSTKRYLKVISDNLTDFRDYDLFEYEMENDNLSHDIEISGLGWFKFVAKGQTFRVLVPKGTEIKETLSKVN